ncbi:MULTISPECIES: type II toxin-antitoxin system VapC family toxin [Yersiniaceae]|jgi:predicted nucleic acid-binding protein|uniref:Ribonuclease VapC n=2 Tax=Yersiniaceae TaxID=1903411 RepID=A0A2N5EPA4_9GAMM|nr:MULTISPECIES: type II toxin-antitoxin system VapC family toxin [Yersiniaceae]MBS0968082.1 type II toxin-antitoxin system VapC family toxin [Nissabacter archeti]MDV5140702.1 type II toxin-antitoxin system VapC family toxin [Chimaeribacter arupi]PLR33856.1 PIN domain-containing protein [Chimaeribacter arupi]PLR51120.1 PIN domain-containing protein [Chimaeribacter arupi]PLR54440.1 PIN domain-containing protein [Chimaeribacter arupi]
MIVLDTSIITEIIRPDPHRQVMQWLDAQDANQLCLTAVTVAELFTAIQSLPGPRQRQLNTALLALLNEEFTHRLLPFDAHCALRAAALSAELRRQGLTLAQSDLYTAAICLHHQAQLATRRPEDFHYCGLAVLNPWGEQGKPRFHEDAAEYYVMSRK